MKMAVAVTRIKKSQTSVPASLIEADALLLKLGQTQNAINEIKKELKKKIIELKAEAKKKLAPLKLERNNQTNALFAFANSRKAELTREVRTIVLGCGSFGWRRTPPRVATTRSDQETVAWLKENGNEAFVRVVEKVDRRALRAVRPVLPGINYVQNDEFFVVPNQKYEKVEIFTQAVDR